MFEWDSNCTGIGSKEIHKYPMRMEEQQFLQAFATALGDLTTIRNARRNAAVHLQQTSELHSNVPGPSTTSGKEELAEFIMVKDMVLVSELEPAKGSKKNVLKREISIKRIFLEYKNFLMGYSKTGGFLSVNRIVSSLFSFVHTPNHQTPPCSGVRKSFGKWAR